MTRSLVPRQNGATLIEVLITVVILSIGLIGLAGLQSTSVQSNQSAYYRSQATILAYDLADRMRANRTEALKDDYVVDFPTSASNNAVTGSQADKDLAQWLNNLALNLPDGTGKVERSDTLVTISVRWDDNRGRIKATDDASTNTEIFVYRTEI